MFEIVCNICNYKNLIEFSNPELGNPRCQKCRDILLNQNDKSSCTCPYCGYNEKLECDELPSEDEELEYECSSCEEEYIVYAQITYTLKSKKKD